VQLPDFYESSKHASPWMRLRRWLIKVLAGKDIAVAINIHVAGEGLQLGVNPGVSWLVQVRTKDLYWLVDHEAYEEMRQRVAQPN
jgi:hypothetical protein